MATQLGQPINLGQTGLISAAKRRLSAPSGVPGLDEEEGQTALSLNPFEQMSTQTSAVAAAPPPQVPQAQLKQFTFNPKYGQLSAGLERNVIDAGQQRNNRLFQTEDLYKSQVGEAEEMNKTAMDKLRAAMAARGLFNSSAMVDQSALQQKGYSKYLDNLGKLKGNQVAGIETDYARSLEDVNRQREGLWFQQVQEEEELARQRAAEEAENARRQQEMELQRQWQAEQQAAMQAQMAAQQEAARQLAAQMARSVSAPSIGVGVPGAGSYGGGGGGYEQKPYQLKDGTPVTEAQMMWQIANDPDANWLNKLWDRDLHLPSHMRQAVLSRIAPNRGWGGGSLAAL